MALGATRFEGAQLAACGVECGRLMDFTVRDLDIVLATIAIRDGGAWLCRLYQRRNVDLKKQHRQVVGRKR